MIKKVFGILLLLLTSMVMFACDTDDIIEQKQDIVGIRFSDKKVTYDGEVHSVKVEGAMPLGVIVEYQNNDKKDVGVYDVIATLSGEKYNSVTLTAKLTIDGKLIEGIVFGNKTFDYDGLSHKVEIVGNLPADVTVTYKSNVTGIKNEATEEGTYQVTATLSGKGYQTLVLNAILIIKPLGAEVFDGIKFDNKSVLYNGGEHSILISGDLPEGTRVTYTSTSEGISNTATEVGIYDVTVTLTKVGYQTLTLQAVLTIGSTQQTEFTGVVFDNHVVEYDSFEHKIVINGVLPANTKVVYTSTSVGVTNGASEVGSYPVTATISKSGYKTLVLNAKLIIQAIDKERAIFVSGTDIYFGNGLDKENLYLYSNGDFTKVNNDEAKYIIGHKGTMYYVSNGLISTAIKSFNGTTAKTVFTENAKYLVSDGSMLYFSVNTLFGDGSGIYQLDIDVEDPVLTKVFTGKTKHLNIVENDIYFANGNDDYKLYKISKTAKDGSPILVLDEKIKEMIYYKGSLYITINKLLGDYLARFIVASNETIKLTSDNAKYLVGAGDYIYYSNVDILNTQVFGKGLYRVAASGLTNNNTPGELVYQTEYNVSSLCAKNDQTILFYRLSDKHLMSFNVLSKTVTDLMDGYIPPVLNTIQPLPKYESFVWKNRVYYINNSIDGALFFYDSVTNENVKVTANSVKSFSIIGNYLYFNQISWLVNNDLYMINLELGGLPQKISNNDARDMVIYQGSLFYVKENTVGVGTAIMRLSLDGSGLEEEIYGYNAHHLTVHDGKLYFIKSAGEGKMFVADILANGSLDNIKQLGSDSTTWFVIVGDQIYYRAVGLIKKTLSKINLDGTNKKELVTGYDPISFIFQNGYIYFTSDTTLPTQKNGIYRSKMDGTGIELLYETNAGDGLAIEMNIVGNFLYYYSHSNVLGDSMFHRLNLTTLASEEIDHK